MHKKNLRSAKMRSITGPVGEATITAVYTGITKEIKGYCNSVSGELNQYYDSLNFTNISNATVYYQRDIRGSTLKNVDFILSPCPNLAGCICEGITVIGSQRRCGDYSIVDSYITFTKDRTETCIKPLGENESILINNFISLVNPDSYYMQKVSKFKPLDLFKAIINPRFLFTNSKGSITITSGEFIDNSVNFETGGKGNLPSDTTIDQFKSYITLDSDKKYLTFAEPINNYVIFNFKYKITIKQEATPKFREGTTSVILEFSGNNELNFPTPRCSVNDDYVNDGILCINYVGKY